MTRGQTISRLVDEHFDPPSDPLGDFVCKHCGNPVYGITKHLHNTHHRFDVEIMPPFSSRSAPTDENGYRIPTARGR